MIDDPQLRQELERIEQNMIENINKDVAGEIKQNGIVKIKNFL